MRLRRASFFAYTHSRSHHILAEFTKSGGKVVTHTLPQKNYILSVWLANFPLAFRHFRKSAIYDAAKRNELLYSTLIFGLLYLATPFLVHCEHKSAGGRADIVVETKSAIYVIELKMDGNGTAEDALKQIDDRGYLIPYTVKKMDDGTPKKLFKIGAVIDSVKRTLGEWKMAEA